MIKVWAEVQRPVIHVDVESNKPGAVNAAYENWRQADEILPNDAARARFGCFSWWGYPGEVIRHHDEVRQEGDYAGRDMRIEKSGGIWC